MRPKYLATILVLLMLAVPASHAHAGGIVSICDEAHLLAALAGGGTVTFSCSGTINLTSTIGIAADTTLDGSGQTVIISGNNAVLVFTVNSGITLNLNRLTVVNGSATIRGSGIFNNGTLTVSNSIFSGNSDSCIYNFGTVTVSNCTFSGNSGSGISNFGMATVSNSTFADNSANEGSGIYNYYGGTVTASNSIFSGNSAGYEGGGIRNDGLMTASNNTFSGNSATYYGGGIRNGGTLTVSNNTFSGNSANAGGGIYNYYVGTVTVSNSIFANNSANDGIGGGIGNSGTLTVSNSTFSDNNATDGGGIGNYGAVTVSNSTFSGNSGGGIFTDWFRTVTLKNSIIANSLGNNCGYGPFTDGGGNLSYPDTTCPGINADPVLGPLQNNGGPTATMALGPGSAAIDAADDAVCAAPPVNNLDQRGIARPQGPHCDIGAVEEYCPSFVPPATVGVEDIVAIAERWGWTDSTPRWDPAYDLNGDNRIDIVDITLVTAAWGRACS